MIFTKTESFNEMYDEIFGESFNKNCTLLSKHMRMIGWKWTDAKNDYPNPDEVKRAVIRLYHELIRTFEEFPISKLEEFNGRLSISTGGFTMALYYDLRKREIDGIDLAFDIWGYADEYDIKFYDSDFYDGDI
jgi:hypothetical protein